MTALLAAFLAGQLFQLAQPALPARPLPQAHHLALPAGTWYAPPLAQTLADLNGWLKQTHYPGPGQAKPWRPVLPLPNHHGGSLDLAFQNPVHDPLSSRILFFLEYRKAQGRLDYVIEREDESGGVFHVTAPPET